MLLRKLVWKECREKCRRLLTINSHYSQCNAAILIHSYSRQFSSASIQLEFNNAKLQKYLESLRKEFYALRVNAANNESAFDRMNQLSGIVNKLEQHRAVRGNMISKEDLENEKDEDMRELIKEENEVYGSLLTKIEGELMTEMLTLTDDQYYPSVIFEVNSGAGGQEAMLFAKELFDMYTNYFDLSGWMYDVLDSDDTDIGGMRHANLIVDDHRAFSLLQYEAGVHRVQRVPSTEKSGRIHTSTVSITVIPRPDDVQVNIADKDIRIETKRASGAGGQHVNTTDSAVRIVHLPTGIAMESQSERSQIKNREIALKKLQARLLRAQLESADVKTKATRKAQQGNLNRNEKIRTYNFVQDRITDHRISGGTVHNLKGFLEGGEHFDAFLQHVVQEHRKSKLNDILKNWIEPPESEQEVQANKQKN